MPRVSSNTAKSDAVTKQAHLTNVSGVENECKLITNSAFLKLRGNDKAYQEALEASSKFNKNLFNERKMRIPFIDSQTRVAQTNCMMWLMEYQRITTKQKPTSAHHIYEYPTKKWYKHRRHLFESASNSESSSSAAAAAADSNGGLSSLGSNQSGELFQAGTNGPPPPSATNSSHLLNENSNSMDSNYYNSSGSAMQQQQLVKQTSNSNEDYEANNTAARLTHHHLAHHDDWSHHEDSFEHMDMINDDGAFNDHSDDDYDDQANRKKKRRGGKGGGSSSLGGRKMKDLTHGGGSDDKPFACDKCGVKYKTKPGLTYHIQKSHGSSGSSSAQNAGHSTNPQANHHNLNHQDENTTNSMFESAFDDMNSSSSLPTTANSSVKKCGICGDTESRQFTQAPNNAAAATNGLTNQSEKFIACFECTKSFHPTCLNFNAKMVQNVKKYSWLCIECKRCTVCGNSENDDKLLFCDDCDRGYHMYCLKPPINEAPAGDWQCPICSVDAKS